MTEKLRNFDADAAQWDDNPGRVKMAETIAEAMRNHCSFTTGMDVLDFGCGTGLVTLHIAPLVRTITGADSSRGMLDVMRSKAGQRGMDNVGCQHLAPGGQPEGEYDAVISSMAFHHVEDTGALLGRLHRILRAGGRLCVADLDPDGGEFHEDNTGVFHKGFERTALRELFRKSGFGNVHDITAVEVTKPGRDGVARTFSVFLMTGMKTSM